ncbi:hypothetical protein L3049_06150 [Labilibaculum sp. DW002]|uniref:Uncharacterized protein n=1 Tax=Paralabilibaculum antarcticum TaxID=2912572 RepID=A0ABT5VQR0_9BACT|nr:hypothetical protein [Labilibaculum sp. DW002]MDE5417585.1 hypothetical protein [Labilibaculum sp. DW002]
MWNGEPNGKLAYLKENRIIKINQQLKKNQKMECEICGNPIEKKRPDSRYCSTSCINKAKRMRAKERELDEFGAYPLIDIDSRKNHQMNQNASAELRTVEREHFNTILSLSTEYGDKIRTLEDTNLKHEFTIEKLNDKISDLKDKHTRDIAEASTSTTKDTVTAITQMPAIQSVLGAFANNLIPSKTNALGGVEDQFNVQEKQIIDAIRRMQPDAQGYLVQMLYVLFAKSHEEQLEIFSTLQTYMMQSEQSSDV